MIKGCTNPECNSFKRNKHYTKKEIKYCPECGNILSHVRKKCPTVLDDGNKVYCMRCEQQKLENQEKRLDKAKKIGGTALGIIVAVGAAIPGVKNILKK